MSDEPRQKFTFYVLRGDPGEISLFQQRQEIPFIKDPYPECRMPLPWINQRTGERDYLEGDPTDANALDYLPQHAEAQRDYQEYRAAGDTVLEAMIKVLEAHVRPLP